MQPEHDDPGRTRATLRIRRAGARGRSSRPGVETYHGLAGGDRHDPTWAGFGALRAVNELVLAPGAAPAAQRRANMEILSWVVEGRLLGDEADAAALEPGQLLRLRAGHGATAQERNASTHAPLRLVQLWLQPDRVNLQPDIARSGFDAGRLGRGWCRLAARGAGDGEIELHGPARVFASRLQAGAGLDLPGSAHARAWLQVLRGRLAVDGETLLAGDAAAADAGGPLRLRAETDGEVLLVLLP